MDYEKLITDITEKIDSFNTDKKEGEQELALVKQRIIELDTLIKELQMKRKIGLLDSGCFEDGDESEAKEFVQWFKAVVFHDEKAISKMQSDVDSAGGYLVPDEFAPRVLRLINKYGLARQLASIIPMSRAKMLFPTLSSGVTVYWGSDMGGQSWTGSGASGIPESNPVFSEASLDTDDMYCLVPIANQLLEDSAVDVANLVLTLIAEAVAAEEDRVAFVGDVSGAGDPFNGVAYSGINLTVISGGSYSDLTADNLLDMTDAIDGSDDNASYLLNRTVLNVVRKLKDTTGNYILQPSITPGEPPTIWGYPYYKTKVMPSVAASVQDKTFVLFGDFRQLYFGDRKKMAIASSVHAQFEKNRTMIRMVERIAIDVPLPAAFAGLIPSSSTTTTT